MVSIFIGVNEQILNIVNYCLKVPILTWVDNLVEVKVKNVVFNLLVLWILQFNHHLLHLKIFLTHVPQRTNIQHFLINTDSLFNSTVLTAILSQTLQIFDSLWSVLFWNVFQYHFISSTNRLNVIDVNKNIQCQLQLFLNQLWFYRNFFFIIILEILSSISKKIFLQCICPL